jgi:hypothetical protein
MTRYLDLLADGLAPVGDCGACRDSLADKCPQHAQDLADHKAVLAGMKAVEDAGTEGQARAAYTVCLLGLTETHGGAR